MTDTQSLLPPQPDLDDQSGTTLAARFKLLKQLGRGGMGAVYLAEDLSTAADADGLRTRVAIKVIKSALVDAPDVVKRFEREAVAVGKLQHPHIVGFRGTGHDAGVHWLAMEYLAGLTLRERIARGAIAWRESLEIIAQITDGLAAAHSAGVLHRDLKPDNVMLVGSGADVVVKLLDFGIAKQVNADAMTMTGTGLIVGTPGFIAPEVIVHGYTDDPRSDLYALGVMWFEMVTATRPFEASTPFALAIKHVQDAPPRPNDVRPFSPIPSPVEAAILRLMEKAPERRPQSAMALAGVIAHLIDVADHPPEPSSSTLRTLEDLGQEQATETGFAAFDSASMPGLVPRPVAPPLTPPPAAPTTVSPPPSSTRTATAVAVAVAVVAVIVTVAAIMLSQRPTSTPVTSTQAPPLPLPAPAQALPPPTLPPVPLLAPPPIPTPAPAPVPAPVSPIKKPPPPKDKPKLLLD